MRAVAQDISRTIKHALLCLCAYPLLCFMEHTLLQVTPVLACVIHMSISIVTLAVAWYVDFDAMLVSAWKATLEGLQRLDDWGSTLDTLMYTSRAHYKKVRDKYRLLTKLTQLRDANKLSFMPETVTQMKAAVRNFRKSPMCRASKIPPAFAGQPYSWRNPRAYLYLKGFWHGVSLELRSISRWSTFLVILTLLCLPLGVMASPIPSTSAKGLTQTLGETAFMSAEYMERAQAQLQEDKARAYDGPRVSMQFSHGIRSHLPEGVTSDINPDRYIKDSQCHLVMDRVPGVTDEQLNSMRDMLRTMAPDVIAYKMEQITGYKGNEPDMALNLLTTAPIFTPARRNWSPAELEVIREKCTELLETGIVRRVSSSSYACNPVLAMKRDVHGEWKDKRFCINFIPINKHTELDRYGSHKANELFDRVSTYKYLTALDLRSGFHQIPMDEDSIMKTAFWYVSAKNPPQLLAYNRMPFGLKNASAKFQRVMDCELQRANCSEFAFAYIDDLLIASNTYEEHVEHVQRVLQMLKECNLKVHPEKSVFGTNVIEYLGHNLVGEHGVTMNTAKVEAIKVLPTPANVPQLRSILGFLAYYRHFIPGYSAIVAPMNSLLKKDKPWNWGESQAAAYLELKRLMTEPGRVLRPVDPDRPLILHTDWCCHGIGAVLGQKDENGLEYLCACISRSVNKHEANYPSYKGELLALAWAIRMFRHHLFGNHFTAVTDHQPLLWLMRARDLNGQYARWQVLLQEYDFDIVHRAGVKHANADVLSRFPRISSRDVSGARFDEERVISVLNNIKKIAPKRPLALIDSFAPRFGDLFHTGVPHVNESTYMDGTMDDRSSLHHNPDAHKQKVMFISQVESLTRSLASFFYDCVYGALQKVLKGHAGWGPPSEYISPGDATHALDTSILGRRFFEHAGVHGVQLVEICGGICTGLDALLRSGTRVLSYCYVDKDPYAQTVARARMFDLSAQYPEQFPPTAWKHAFDLPSDLSAIDVRHLVQWQKDSHSIGAAKCATLVVAGWPCQDYSPAGKGQLGARAALLQELLRVLRFFQNSNRSSHNPVGYILENVAVQHNFRHAHLRWPVWHDLVSQLYLPITFDAVQVGSHSHRLRNYWTNLVDARRAGQIFEYVHAYPTTPLSEILDSGRRVNEVLPTEGVQSGHRVNEPGKPRIVFPTFTSYPMSRAFREGKPGSVMYDTRDRNGETVTVYTEPNGDERERCLGFEPGITSSVSEAHRKRLLGQAMDLHSISALWEVSFIMGDLNEAADEKLLQQTPVALPIARYSPPGMPSATAHKVRKQVKFALPALEGTSETDIWEDLPTITVLQGGAWPAGAAEASRVRKRIKQFRWISGQLHRFVPVKGYDHMKLRLVPLPAARDQVILNLHTELGHIGRRRTAEAVASAYWWHGMTVDVNRMLSTCKVCARARASQRAENNEMKTEPHDIYGMFFRWGLDYLGELPPSASGNRYALIFIDYFTKWVEVIPVKTADAETTMRVIQMHLIARYGVPAEFICDNGTPFKGTFEAYCVDRCINQRFITPGMPRTNGLAERAVQTIKRAIQKYAAESHSAQNWDTDGLSGILMGYRLTTQRSTEVSPAQALFAQDPAVHADKWIYEMGALEYTEASEEHDAEKLLERAIMAKELRLQMVENLRLAHARNAARFKALRTGVYKPKVYHFKPGDFVFYINRDDIPGGAAGMAARDEILKVVEVLPSGTLNLVNQHSVPISHHMEQCAPCNLSNVEGTEHPDMVKPSWKFPCSVCGDHRKGHKMLLCDGCNLGFHIYCLPHPLDDIPAEDIWLCHQCTATGMTTADVLDRRTKYIPVERSRPRIELPGRTRRALARELAAVWHNKVVRLVTSKFTGIGRILFTEPDQQHWFHILWADRPSKPDTYHDRRILARLEVLPPDEYPANIAPEAPAVQVWIALEHPWSIHTIADINQRLQQGMPGVHRDNAALMVHRAIQRNYRTEITKIHPASVLDILNSAVDVTTCRVILDPWAGSRAVVQGLHVGKARFHHNEKMPTPNPELVHEPLESHLYEDLRRKCGCLDAVVMVPPIELADMALINALDYAGRIVCMFVNEDYLLSAHPARRALFAKLESHGRFLLVRDLDPACAHCWICVFASLEERMALLRPGMEPGSSNYLLMERHQVKALAVLTGC